MEVKAPLQTLDLGSSVAELDEALDRCFFETEAFRALALDWFVTREELDQYKESEIVFDNETKRAKIYP